MEIVYHPLVKRDLREAFDFLDSVSIYARAKFEEEFEQQVLLAASMPTRYSLYLGHHIFRRAKLPSFPYLIIYRVIPDGIRVTVLKHERRRPRFGMGRW